VKQDVARSLVSFERTGDGFRAVFRFAGDLDVFRGHFPGHPLVPGIFLIEAVRCAAERALASELRIAEVVDARFGAEVGPEDDVEIEAELSDLTCKAKLGAKTRIHLRLAVLAA
jgi:3-hydroxyacyl-[acyl-carrier-protein] dehydratase